MVAYTSLLVPQVSLRSPSFFGPVLLGTCLLIASSVTAPIYKGFNIVKIADPTYKVTLGIWATCQGFKSDNATTANPNATLTGNSTLDSIIHHQGVHQACSPAHVGWTYSVPVNDTGLAGILPPDTNMGVNVADNSQDGNGNTFKLVMTSSQTSMLLVHLIAGIVPALGLLLLLIPYRSFQETSPNLSRFLKTGSVTMICTLIGFVLGLIAFGIDLSVSKAVVDKINAIGGGGGAKATLGNLQWFALSSSIVMIPGIYSSRGQM